MNAFQPGWFVIYTRPRHEKKVADQLTITGTSHFLPLVKSLRTWSDRRKYIDTSLFPSYVFVHLEDMQQYFSSLELHGVLHYVRSGKEIARVSEAVIHNLQLIVSNPYTDIAISTDYIMPGEKLIVHDGPFTGFNCEVIRHNGKRKVLVRIDLIQRNVIVDMPLESLLPAAATITAHA